MLNSVPTPEPNFDCRENPSHIVTWVSDRRCRRPPCLPVLFPVLDGAT